MSTSAMPINFTDSAAHKVNQLIQEEGNPELKLRVFITGGGCSGFQYGFTFDESINQDDMVIEKILASEDIAMWCDLLHSLDWCNSSNKRQQQFIIAWLLLASLNQVSKSRAGGSVKLLVDAMSFQYLAGAKIDYRDDVNGAQFVISNPNAKTTCGCGSSFAA